MSLDAYLDDILSRHLSNVDGPGVQVALVSPDGLLYEGAVGLANPVACDTSQKLTTTHQANLYSVSKFVTACCILKLIDEGKIRPTDRIKDYLPSKDMRELVNDCTVEQLVAHEAGAPNPMPLKWVHAPDETVDETELLTKVLRANPFPPLRRDGAAALPYRYSNVGYWVLGHVVTSACGKPPSSFAQCCQELLFSDVPILKEESERIISDKFTPNAPMAYGHVPRWSMLALAARLLCPSGLIGPTNRSWIQMEPHYLDGVGYGGLIGSSRSVAAFLASLLKGSVLSPASTNRLYVPVNEEMTFGLHVRPHRGVRIYHKEGGGAGCHSSIQIRPQDRIAGCVIAGDATFDVNGLLDEMMDCAQDRAAAKNAAKSVVARTTKVVKSTCGTKVHTKLYENAGKVSSEALLSTQTVLLLHGGPGVPDYLEDLAMLLIHSNVAASVICFDQRGVGLSQLPQGRCITMELLLDDIEMVKKAYGLNKIHLVGHSWGAVLAQLYSQKKPDHVASLVLLSPTTVSRASDWSKMERSVMSHNRRKGLVNFTKLGFWSLVLRLPIVSGYAARSIFTLIMKNYYFDPASAPDPPECFFAGVSAKAMFASKKAFLEYAKEPISLQWDRFPSLCVFGEEDIYGKELMDDFCKGFQGEIAYIPQSSHLSWVDQPIQLVRLLNNFYGKC